MPIQDRKYYIQRHNAEVEAENNNYNSQYKNNNEREISGEMLNSYASLEQKKMQQN